MSFALIVSRICEPILLFLVLFYFVLLRAGIPVQGQWNYWVVLLSVVLVPTIALLVYALKTKKISNWDISNREERVKALPVFLGFFLLGLICIFLLGNIMVTKFMVFFFILNALFFLITIWFKLSGHMANAVVFIGIAIIWFGGSSWMLAGMVPLLSWSRLVLKRHTVSQVIVGIVFGVAMVIVGRQLMLIY